MQRVASIPLISGISKSIRTTLYVLALTAATASAPLSTLFSW